MKPRYTCKSDQQMDRNDYTYLLHRVQEPQPLCLLRHSTDCQERDRTATLNNNPLMSHCFSTGWGERLDASRIKVQFKMLQTPLSRDSDLTRLTLDYLARVGVLRRSVMAYRATIICELTSRETASPSCCRGVTSWKQ